MEIYDLEIVVAIDRGQNCRWIFLCYFSIALAAWSNRKSILEIKKLKLTKTYDKNVWEHRNFSDRYFQRKTRENASYGKITNVLMITNWFWIHVCSAGRSFQQKGRV